MEKKAIDNADKMDTPPKTRQPTPLEEAWLRCDYVLWNMLDRRAYATMEWLRKNEVEAYKTLYRKLVSPAMMENIQLYVDWFASGGKCVQISNKVVMKHYLDYKGYKRTISVQHGGTRKELRDHIKEEE